MSGKPKEAAKPVPANANRLVSQYRAIGPAAIVAALICMPKTNKPSFQIAKRA